MTIAVVHCLCKPRKTGQVRPSTHWSGKGTRPSGGADDQFEGARRHLSRSPVSTADAVFLPASSAALTS